MSALEPGGLLVLEIGVAEGDADEFVPIARSITAENDDTRFFTAHKKDAWVMRRPAYAHYEAYQKYLERLCDIDEPAYLAANPCRPGCRRGQTARRQVSLLAFRQAGKKKTAVGGCCKNPSLARWLRFAKGVYVAGILPLNSTHRMGFPKEFTQSLCPPAPFGRTGPVSATGGNTSLGHFKMNLF